MQKPCICLEDIGYFECLDLDNLNNDFKNILGAPNTLKTLKTTNVLNNFGTITLKPVKIRNLENLKDSKI